MTAEEQIAQAAAAAATPVQGINVNNAIVPERGVKYPVKVTKLSATPNERGSYSYLLSEGHGLDLGDIQMYGRDARLNRVFYSPQNLASQGVETKANMVFVVGNDGVTRPALGRSEAAIKEDVQLSDASRKVAQLSRKGFGGAKQHVEKHLASKLMDDIFGQMVEEAVAEEAEA